jgi:MFS family permease
MTDDGYGIPWESRPLQLVLLSSLLTPLGVPFVSPALPILRRAFAVSETTASLFVSAYFVVGIGLSPFVGLVADRIGRRRVLVGSLTVFSLTGAAVAVAPSFPVAIGLRVVQGSAAAGVFVTTVTLIGELFGGFQRSAVLGANTAVVASGAAVFPLVGGALVSLGWNAPFVVYLVGLPVGLVVSRLLDIEEPAPDGRERGLDFLRRALGHAADANVLVLYGAAFATDLLLFGAIITALPFLLRSAYGLPTVVVGATLTVTEAVAAVVALLSGRFARRRSNERLVAVGFCCFGVGLVLAWFDPDSLVLGAGLALFGAGIGLAFPAVDAAVSRRVPDRVRGGALSLRNSATFLGRAVGPLVFTLGATLVGYRSLLLGAGVAALGGGALALVSTVDVAASVRGE